MTTDEGTPTPPESHSDGVQKGPEASTAAPVVPLGALRAAVAHATARGNPVNAEVRRREMAGRRIVGPGTIEVEVAGCTGCGGKDFRLHRSGAIRCAGCNRLVDGARWVMPGGPR